MANIEHVNAIETFSPVTKFILHNDVWWSRGMSDSHICSGTVRFLRHQACF